MAALRLCAGMSESENTVHRPTSPSEDAFREIIAAYGLISRLMHDHFARFGISGAKWAVLRTLQRAEAEGIRALRPVELGERLLVRPPSISTIVARLQREGLVALRPSESDRRGKLIALTDRGRALVDRILAVHPARIRRVMSALGTAEQRRLLGLLRALNGGFRDSLTAEHHAPARRRAV